MPSFDSYRDGAQGTCARSSSCGERLAGAGCTCRVGGHIRLIQPRLGSPRSMTWRRSGVTRHRVLADRMIHPYPSNRTIGIGVGAVLSINTAVLSINTKACAKLLHVRYRERIRTSTAARIDPIGRLADPAAMDIEYTEQARLIFCSLGIYVAQRVCLHKKRNLKRFVIRPKSHTALPSVITPTLIGKIEWHSSYHSPFPLSGVRFICAVARDGRAIRHDTMM